MKGIGKRQQDLPGVIKKQPERNDREYQVNRAENRLKRPALRCFLLNLLAQAGSADDAIFVFGDTFAAEEAPAYRAARSCLPQRMIYASLLRQICLHQCASLRYCIISTIPVSPSTSAQDAENR